MLRHQVPAGYPLTPEDLATLITKAGLREVKRTYVLPIVSEAMVIECVAASPGA